VPKRFEIVWTSIALEDLSEIIDYVSCHDTAMAAIHLHDRIIANIETLPTHPTRCRVIPELREVGVSEFREALVGPYRVPFRVDRGRVVLLGVFDGRRDLQELLLARAMRG